MRTPEQRREFTRLLQEEEAAPGAASAGADPEPVSHEVKQPDLGNTAAGLARLLWATWRLDQGGTLIENGPAWEAAMALGICPKGAKCIKENCGLDHSQDPDNGAWARAQGGAVPPPLDVALDALNRDAHHWSKRPCPTCSKITAALGKPFGCDWFRLISEGSGE